MKPNLKKEKIIVTTFAVILMESVWFSVVVDWNSVEYKIVHKGLKNSNPEYKKVIY